MAGRPRRGPLPRRDPATKADVARAYDDNKLAQVLYHDWEAQTYDDKWSISFDEPLRGLRP